MADVEILDLDDGVAVLGTDYAEVTRDPAGTPASVRVPLGLIEHSELTIASGAISPTHGGLWIVDTEADASQDDLETIAVLPEGTVIGIYIADDARDVVLVTSGNLLLPGVASFRLRDTDEIAWLRSDGTNWRMINFGGMGQVSQAQAEAAAVTAPFLWSPERIGQAIAKLAGAGKQTIPFLPTAMWSPVTDGARFGKALLSGNTVPYMAFSTSTDEHIYIPFCPPKAVDESVAITFDFLWSHPSTATNFGVAFFFEILAVGDDDLLTGAMGTAVEVDDTGGTTSDLYRSPESAAVTPGGSWTEADMLLIHIYRDVSDSFDNLAVDARLHQINMYLTFNNGNDA